MQLCPSAHKLGLPARERTPNELSLEIEHTFKILIPLMEVRRIVLPRIHMRLRGFLWVNWPIYEQAAQGNLR